MNRWRIPPELEKRIRERDVACVYCGVKLLESVPRGTPRKHVATWEHIVNDATIVSLQNIARCCNSCNASKGSKHLREWLETNYCKRQGITIDSVAAVVHEHLASYWPIEVNLGN
jgi:5-methylcytosine-specific restriction endonuclease McrA